MPRADLVREKLNLTGTDATVRLQLLVAPYLDEPLWRCRGDEVFAENDYGGVGECSNW
jgi:hypothetical protein